MSAHDLNKNMKGIVYIALCIDDNVIIGNPKAIDGAA